MKHFISIILISFFFCSISTYAQTYELTFKVDMSYETVSADGVHVAGNFQTAAGYPSNWDPAGTELTDDDLDNIYEITVSLAPGTYLYKFINGDDWGEKPEDPDEFCAIDDGGGNMNRQFILGEANRNLPVVIFDSCNAVIYFSVNMGSETISPNGVHVFGNFQTASGYDSDWDPASIQMEDLNGDGSYEIQVEVPPGEYQYLYVNGDQATDAEEPPVDCTVDDGSGNRVRLLQAEVEGDSPLTYCFGTCDICNPNINPNYDTYWWNDAVFYEIFVRSFYDSDNDGIGDFQGIIEKLDYLNDGNPETDDDLGITGIWLMPIMESPSYHGYDATDYYAIEPDYGTMSDFEEFLTEAHARGINVILDLVLNHCSSQHPWFTQSVNDQNGYRDWFIWEDTDPGFLGPWGQTVWHYNNGAYYYGIFWSGMPDLNYSHEPVKTEMFGIADYWLNKGVDGFRLDAIMYLDEDGEILSNTPETFQHLQDFRASYEATNPNAFTVGEVWQTTSEVIPYVTENRLNTCFEFDLANAIINDVNNNSTSSISNQMNEVSSSYPKLQYSTFLTNHDINRIFSQFDSDEAKMKQAATAYLTLPGVPFVYYGEEIGMIGTGADENKRRPMQWTAGTNAGFSSVTPWYSVGDNYVTNNVETMSNDPGSLLNHYKKLFQIRNDQEALRKGYYLEVNASDDNILSYARIYEQEAVIAVSNFGETQAATDLSLDASSLEQGEYYVSELYSNRYIGTINIDVNGGFSAYIPGDISELESRGSILLLISQSQILDIEEQTADELDIQIYPNPAKEFTNIFISGNEIKDVLVTVTDINGKIKDEIQFSGSSYTLDTRNYPQGIWFLNVQTEKRNKVFQLIITK